MMVHSGTLEREEETVKLPSVSVIIPTYNHSADIGFTLESLLSQELLPHEILIIDACSTDRTLEIIKSFRSDLIKIFSVSNYVPPEMWNRGIIASHGDYLNFLQPGTCYLSNEVLHNVMETAAKNGCPLLVYGASQKRFKGQDPQLILNPFSPDLMAKGIAPTTLEACWFSKGVFQKMGTTFSTGFELLSRLSKVEGKIAAFTSRVVIDAPIRLKRKRDKWVDFKERWRAIRTYFGIGKALKWLMTD